MNRVYWSIVYFDTTSITSVHSSTDTEQQRVGHTAVCSRESAEACTLQVGLELVEVYRDYKDTAPSSTAVAPAIPQPSRVHANAAYHRRSRQ